MDENEQSLLEEVLATKLDNLLVQTPGSKEASSATNDVKVLGDLHNQELKIYLEDADRIARREMEEEIKKAELEFKEKELDFKISNLEHEKEVHQHNKKVDYIKIALESLGIIGTGIGIAMGYQFEYKYNGVATGKTFNNLRSALKFKKH